MEWWNPLHSPSVSSGNPLNFPSQINESSSKWLGKRKKEERKKERKRKNPHALKPAINLSLTGGTDDLPKLIPHLT